MMKAIAVTEDGKELLVIGLSFGNLDRLRASPGNSHMMINGKEMGLPVDVMIFSGETEVDLIESISTSLAPDAEVTISAKLKSS